MIVVVPSRRSRIAFALACLLAALAPWLGAEAAASDEALPFPGWARLVPVGFHEIALSEQERLFAEGFPGRVARFSNGRQELVMRWTATASRRLHPSEHCLRGAGFELRPAARGPAVRPGATAWIAERGEQRLLVQEWIEAGDGRVFASVGEWYWPSALGRSRGPWVAYTLSEPFDEFVATAALGDGRALR